MRIFCSRAVAGIIAFALFAATASAVTPSKAGDWSRYHSRAGDWGRYSRHAYDWTGFYGSIGGGYGSVNYEVEGGIPGFFWGAGDSDGNGGFFSLGVGGDYQVNPYFVIGAFFEYDWTNYDVSESGFGWRAELEAENQWYLGARVGVLPLPTTMAFVAFGYTEMKTDDLEVSLLGTTARFGVDTFSGWFVGGGVEHQLGYDFTLKAEYRYASFDSENVNLLLNIVQMDLEPEVHTGRLAVVYRLGH